MSARQPRSDGVGGARTLYVTGGKQRRRSSGLDEWQAYERGVVVRVDLASGECATVAEYESLPDAIPPGARSTSFRCGSLLEGLLAVCTQTEVVCYRVSDFSIVRRVSLPLFNDLHHALALEDGRLLVVSTGLDMVVEVTPDDRVGRVWSVCDAEPWQRFSPDTDYRMLLTTKPHHSHPNYVFLLEGEVWATRFEQRDARCLTARLPPIAIELQAPHDGIVGEDAVYFTTVDGRLIEVDPRTRAKRRVHDLTRCHAEPTPLGWCRGVLRQGSTTWVGYSRLRPTLIRKNLSWVKHGFDSGHFTRPTRLVSYDLERAAVLSEIDLEPHGLNSIFSILASDL